MVSTFIAQPSDWLAKAERDLLGAITMHRSNLYDLSVYHTQQSAEKALKGYLCYKNHSLLKTHDIGILLKACKSYDNDFLNIERTALQLNQLDIEFRYPLPIFEPPESATLQAINDAESVLNFVRNKII